MNNDNEPSTETAVAVTTESNEKAESMTQPGEESNDQNLVPVETNDDEFIRITAAHQILTEGERSNSSSRSLTTFSLSFLVAQTYDEQKNYSAALHLYRICVDLLLEELMFTEGTDQSRVYLREKCTAIMDHIDVLKTKLEPIDEAEKKEDDVTIANAAIEAPPSEELSSLHLS